MTRLGVAARNEVRLQWRYGVYAAALFATAVWVAVLRALPAGAMATAVPVVVFADSAVGLFFLVVLLTGYATAVRFESITDYVVGVQAPLLPLALPLLPYLGDAVAHLPGGSRRPTAPWC